MVGMVDMVGSKLGELVTFLGMLQVQGTKESGWAGRRRLLLHGMRRPVVPDLVRDEIDGELVRRQAFFGRKAK